jgi:predicted ATPase/class 3 adenylate cyclase
MTDLPAGTVTFLFTDLEGSTRLWQEHPDAMKDALARHDAILNDALELHHGHVVKTTGDGVHAVFVNPSDAIDAAIAAQVGLGEESWGATGALRVRMGIHSGVAELRGADYYGTAVNKAARVMSVAHGGQVVVSLATEELVRDALGDEVALLDLGEHRLRDLARAERLFQVTAPGLQPEFAALRSLEAFPGNLPLQVSSFVGRELELNRVADALHDARVVTLTGVGGVGKTRLALQVAAELLPEFRDGAWLLELAPVRDPDGVVDAFAALFRVTPRGDQTLDAALVEFFGSKQLLLVIDNCEHVLEAVAHVVDSVERACAGIVVLATSREGLALEGERIIAVPSLAGPGAALDVESVMTSEAVRLFVERARAADAEFALDGANAAAVAQVCRRLDGVPLAIELAASRVTVMTPEELAGALDRRFEVLAGGRRGGIERHQTLRATIDWSYEPLGEAQRRVLARLSVFAGGCTREAAEAICAGDPVDAASVFEILADLVARSLVVAERRGAETRYRLLETIRAYGEERLAEHGETLAVRDRHTRYFIERGRVMTLGMIGPEQVTWGNRLLTEHENYLAAMTHAIDSQDVDLALGLLESLPRAQIGKQLHLPADPVLALPDVDQHPAYPIALIVAAFDAIRVGEVFQAEQRAQEALEAARIFGDREQDIVPFDGLVSVLRGFIANARGAFVECGEAFLEGAAIADAHHLPSIAAFWRGTAASALSLGGERDAAVPIATEGLAAARTIGMPTAIVFNLYALAQALADRDPERAHELLDEALEVNATLGYEMQNELLGMTLVAVRLDDWRLTARLARQSLHHLQWSNERPMLVGILNVVARAIVTADPESAAVLQGAAGTIALAVAASAPVGSADSSAGSGPGLILQTRRDTTQHLREVLGDDQLRHLREQGASMDIDSAFTYTFERLDAYLAGDD